MFPRPQFPLFELQVTSDPLQFLLGAFNFEFNVKHLHVSLTPDKVATSQSTKDKKDPTEGVVDDALLALNGFLKSAGKGGGRV